MGHMSGMLHSINERECCGVKWGRRGKRGARCDGWGEWDSEMGMVSNGAGSKGMGAMG